MRNRQERPHGIENEGNFRESENDKNKGVGKLENVSSLCFTSTAVN